MTLVTSPEQISNAELEAVVAASADVMVKISEAGRILGCRVGRFADPLWDANALLGKEVEQTFLNNNTISFRKAIRNVVAAQDAHKMEYFIQVPEEKKWFEVRMLPAENHEVLAVFKDITSEKKAQEEKLHTETLFRAIFDNTYQFTALLSPDGKLLHINKTALDFSGITLEEVQDKPFKEAPWWNVPNTQISRLQAAIRSAAANNFVRYETPVLGGDGNIYFLDFSLKAINDDAGQVMFLIAEGRDITERKKIEEELLRTEKMYRTIARNIPRGMLLVLNNEMRFTLAEGEMISVLGSKKEEIEGKTLRELSTNPEIFNLLYDKYKAGLEGKANTFEFKADTENIFFHVIVQPIVKPDGSVDEVLVLVYDVYEQKKMARELEQNMHELQSTVKTLQQKNEQLEQFAYISSHDLQEPLRMVVSYTQLLEQKFAQSIDPEAIEFIGFAREGAQRMQRIIYDLMLYNELDNSSLRHCQNINAGQAVKTILHKFIAEIEMTGAKVYYDALPVVWADPKELVLMIENILSNAIKFTAPDKTPEIHISATETENHWIFAIKDNGIGIQQNHLNRIFNIFQRLNTRQQYTGSGIGLAICKKIAELHGGNIWVESAENIGSTFYFSLGKPSS